MDRRLVLLNMKRITRYELARILSVRALQLSLGAPPLIDISSLEKKDSFYIALEEVRRRVLPIVIKRRLPSGEEYMLSLRDLEIDLSGLDHG